MVSSQSLNKAVFLGRGGIGGVSLGSHDFEAKAIEVRIFP